MTDQELCDQINANLPPGWEPFEPLGDGRTVQGYRQGKRFGVMGNGERWRVVFAEDGLVADSGAYRRVEEAMAQAEQEEADEL